ncbi:NAD(P)-dependent alcohol dehydrogenase [Salinirubrum litoreum]|uniref:NAD(P)-dependent alcohol dehydrogenase n=1 Tax=Salinirubrum litoreum TaxID=1126234 RepID=A0ABD5RG55_9EURY|nr:NAD(P)-dependent alcohol dehydrogenase [Salinirubrum litoreum]
MAADEFQPTPDTAISEAPDIEETRMHAIVQLTYGGPEVLSFTTVEKPVPDDDEVLVRVVAASVGVGDWHLMRGSPLLVRLVYGGYRRPKFPTVGVDVAGSVEAVGRNVTGFVVGDAVLADLSEHGFGGFAEYVCVPATALVRKPASVPFEMAATIPTSAVAALQALRDAGQLQAGEHVLINGASGGVGTFAVQIAKYLGAEVTGVCSTAKADLVRSIGADHVVDYTTTDVTTAGTQYDLIVDTAGSHPMRAYRRVLTPTGRYVMVGGPTRRFVSAMLGGPLLSAIGTQRFGGFTLQPDPADLAFVAQLLESDDVTPVVDRQYPLREVPEAIRYLEAGHATGKVVITSDTPV